MDQDQAAALRGSKQQTDVIFPIATETPSVDQNDASILLSGHMKYFRPLVGADKHPTVNLGNPLELLLNSMGKRHENHADRSGL
jgi:hypothetical protein